VVRRALIYLLHFLSRTFLAGNRFVFESTADWNEEFSLRTCLRFTASPWPQEKLSLPRRHTNTQTQCSICTAHWCPCSKAHPPLCLIRPQWQCSFNNSTNCVSRQKPLITFRAPANGEIAVGFFALFSHGQRCVCVIWQQEQQEQQLLAISLSLVGCLLIIDSGCH